MLRFGAIVFVLVTVVAAGGLVYVSSPPGEKWIKRMLESQLESALSQPVRISEFETNLFSRVRISGLEILDNRNTSPVLAINNIRLGYSLFPLFRGDIHLMSVDVDAALLAIRRDTLGRTGLAIIDEREEYDESPAETSGSRFKIVIDTLSLSTLSVEFADEMRQMFAGVKDVSLAVTRTQPSTHSFVADIQSGSVRYGSELPAEILLTLAGHISPELLSIDELKAKIAGVDIRGRAAIPEKEDQRLRAEFSAAGNPNSLLRAVGQPDVQFEGEMSIGATATGTRENFVVDLRSLFPRTQVRGMAIESALLRARANSREVEVDTLCILAYGGLLRASGVYVIADTVLRTGEVAFSKINFGTLVRDLTGSVPPTTGLVSGILSTKGRGVKPSDWDATVEVTFAGVKLRDEDLPGAVMSGRLSGGEFNALFEQDSNSLVVHGRVTEKSLRGQLRVDIPRVSAFARLGGLDEARGDFHADGTFHFSGSGSEVSLIARGSGLAYRNLPLDTILADIQYRGKEVRIAALEFAGALNPIDPTSPPFDLNGLSGSVEYAGQLSGTPNNLQGHITAALTKLEYEGKSLDSAGVRLALDGSIIEVAHGRIVKDSLELLLDGMFDTRKTAGEFEVYAFVVQDSAGTPLRKETGSVVTRFLAGRTTMELTSEGRQIELSAFLTLAPDSLQIGGKANFDLSISGASRNPDVRLRANITDPLFHAIRLDSIVTDVSLSNHLVDVERLSVHRRQHQATATGTILLTRDSTGSHSITPKSPIRGELAVRRFDLQTFEPLMPKGGSLSGRTSLDMAWSGTVARPIVTGVAIMDSVKVSYTPEVEPLELSMKALLSDTIITIDYANGRALGQPFVVSGYVTRQGLDNLRTDLKMDFSESGSFIGKGVIGREKIDFAAEIDRLDLTLFRPFAARAKDLSGRIDSRVTLSGNTAMPDMQGYLTARNVSLRPDAMDQTINDGILKASFRGNGVTIDSLFARVDEGTIFATGSFAVAQEAVRDVRLSARAGRIRLSSPEEFLVTIDTAGLQYAPRNEYYLLTGDIKFGESRLTKNLEPDAILPWARSVERPETELPVLLQQTRMDIRLRESENLWVDNNLARMRLHAELSITGNPARPNLSGRLNITNGYLLYLDRKFDVKEGEFLFSDPNRLNPDIKLKAQSQVTTYQGISPQTYNVQFSAEGPMEQLVVNLTSDPPLDKPDIVALLTVGATRSQLTAGDGGARNVLIDRVQMIASGRISNMLTQRAGSLLGLDEMTVQGNLFSFNGEASPKLVLGKQITDRARVTYSTTVGRSNEQSFRVDYQLTKRFSLLGETTQAGRSSLSLKYGFLFK